MSRGTDSENSGSLNGRNESMAQITCEDELDPDVMASMSSLGCFKDREALIATGHKITFQGERCKPQGLQPYGGFVVSYANFGEVSGVSESNSRSL